MPDTTNSGSKAVHASTRRYGWRPSLPDQRDKYMRFGQRQFDALTALDHVDLTPGMAPCYDQSDLGSCTSQAIAGVLQYDAIHQKLADQTTPSRLMIYWNERYLDPYTSVNEDTGSTITMGIRAVKTYGFCDESDWPYNTQKFAVEPPSSCYTAAVKNRITDYARVNQALPDLQAALAAGHPIAFGFSVYSSFESRAVADSGVVPMPKRNERMVGGHAVVLMGFDNPTQRFIVRNSWGDDWGNKGYFTIPYAYITNKNLSGDFWIINSIPGTAAVTEVSA